MTLAADPQRTLVLIPARMESTRLPGKPLADIAGAPMIVHVMRRAEAAGIGQVAVATDSAAVRDAVMSAGGTVVMTRADHPSGSDRIAEALATLPGGGFVLLDTTTTPELEAEGLARDAIRVVQEARKNAGLEVSDRIVLALSAGPAQIGALEQHAALIAAETLAVAISVQLTEGLDAVIDTLQHPGDGVFISGVRALGVEKAPMVVTIDVNGVTGQETKA